MLKLTQVIISIFLEKNRCHNSVQGLSGYTLFFVLVKMLPTRKIKNLVSSAEAVNSEQMVKLSLCSL